jgi:phosphatidate cytidylyltransferase
MPKTDTARWGDLKARLLSALVMVVLGCFGVIAGGIWFQMLVVFACAVMVWELWMMIHPKAPSAGMLIAVVLATVMSAVFANSQDYLICTLLLAIPILAATQLPKERGIFIVFAIAILTAGWSLVELRNGAGLMWVLWLIGVVVATDIAGYFGGRMIGGPKFWPAISPKKTWSGTIAGWIAAACVALILIAMTEASSALILISIALSFAGQMGDIAQSAIKRRVGIKDSSDLIPGHGGLFDRFDALLAAALCLFLLQMYYPLQGISF